MKTLVYCKKEYIADKIIKTEKEITGYDSSENEIFKFSGISDFTVFSLKDNATYDEIEKTSIELEIEQIQKDNSDIMYVLMNGGLL